MAADPEVMKKVKECLNEVKKLEEKKEDIESVISVISNTLEEVCGEEGCLEAAPLQYKLAQLLIDGVHARAENEEEMEGMEGLDEDDLQAAWDNLEMAKYQYENAEDKKDYRKEISDILMLLHDIDVEKGDYENGVEHCKEALALREALFAPHSRKVADCMFSLGLAYDGHARTCALESVDEPEKADVAVEHSKKAVEYLKKAQKSMMMVTLEMAKEKEVTEENCESRFAELQKKEEEKLEEEVKDLMSIVEDMKGTIETATNFSVKAVIEENQQALSELHKLMEEMGDEDDEEDEDFEEEEEEEEDGDDVVIEDVEELKKSIKRVAGEMDNGDEEEENAKHAKME